MHQRNHPIEFEVVLEKLRAWREHTLIELKSPETHEAALHLRRQLEAAIGCLELCERHQIRPDAQTVVLPAAQHPFSEYRIMEDHDCEHRNGWTEVKVDGTQVWLHPGDIIIR